MKPQPEDQPLDRFENFRPDEIALATLASQARFASLPDDEAVRAALRLLSTARDVAAWQRKVDCLWHRERVEAIKELKRPETFPASFDAVLKCIDSGKSIAVRRENFREYVAFVVEPQHKLAGEGRTKLELAGLATLAEAVEATSADYANRRYSRERFEELAFEYRRFRDRMTSEGRKRPPGE